MEKSKALDQFYTNPLLAERFVNVINNFIDLKSFDNVIEPSAGTGAILDFLPESNRIGLDLDPKREDILEGDFFDYKFPSGNNAVVGNPPFGKQSKLAVEFFNKCAQHSELIAFIIPRSWMKFRIQNQLNKDFGLYYSAVLPDAAFIYNDKAHKVRCCAQIWMKRDLAATLPEVMIDDQLQSWNDLVTQETLTKLHNYQLKNNCYERLETLF